MEFEKVTATKKRGDYITKGQLRVTPHGLYFGDKVYDAIGRPPKIGVSVDRHGQSIQLDPLGSDSPIDGWKPNRYTMVSGEAQYRLRVARSPLFNQMPIGIYYPIGGGIFAFNTQNNHA